MYERNPVRFPVTRTSACTLYSVLYARARRKRAESAGYLGDPLNRCPERKDPRRRSSREIRPLLSPVVELAIGVAGATLISDAIDPLAPFDSRLICNQTTTTAIGQSPRVFGFLYFSLRAFRVVGLCAVIEPTFRRHLEPRRWTDAKVVGPTQLKLIAWTWKLKENTGRKIQSCC